jgi:hypothetical protein
METDETMLPAVPVRFADMHDRAIGDHARNASLPENAAA